MKKRHGVVRRVGRDFKLTADALEILEGLRLKSLATGVCRSISQLLGQEVLEAVMFMRLDGREVVPKQRFHASMAPEELRALEMLADHWGLDASGALEVIVRLRSGHLSNPYEGPYRLERRGTKEATS